MRILTLVASALAASALSASALEYAPTLELATINLMDEATKIGEIQSIFVDDVTLVSLSGIEWVLLEDEGTNVTEQSNLVWETAVNGVVESTGTIDLSDTIDRDLPTDIEAGSIVVKSKQTAEVSVKIYLEDKVIVTSSQTSKTYQAYGRGVSIVPLVMILFLAMTTKMVELSLFLGIWLGSCILTGSLAGGFTMTLDTFLLEALTNEGHVFVILFSVFLSGLVGMLQKSGGMLGFTNLCTKYSKTPRAGQFACMLLGVIVFFDDYANVLLTGETMKPLLDVLFVSREKLSFIVDATSAPIASIAPISSWVGYEAGLVNDALVELKKRNGGEALTIPETGFGVFLQSIRYSYYSWFMLGLIAMLIISQRDYGPMLIAERKVRVYDRTDGGDGANNSGKSLENKANEPEKDQPLLIHNMLIPIVVWIILVFTILVDSGDDGSGSQSFLEKIESGDSYVALLYGTMGTVWVTIILYMLQITIPGTGKLALPTPSVLLDMMPWRKATVEQRGDQQPRFVLTIYESVESFLYGMTRIFLAIVVLVRFKILQSQNHFQSFSSDKLFFDFYLLQMNIDARMGMWFCHGLGWCGSIVCFVDHWRRHSLSNHAYFDLRYCLAHGPIYGNLLDNHGHPLSTDPSSYL